MWIRLGALWLFLLCSYWLKDVAIGTDYRLFFADEHPDRVALDTFEQNFGKTDSALVVVTTNEGSILSKRYRQVVTALEASLKQAPYAIHTTSVFSSWPSQQQPTDVASYYGTLLNEEHTSTGISVTIDMSPERPNAVNEAAGFIRDVMQTHRKMYPELRIDASGIVMMNHAFAENLLDDLFVLVPLSNLVMFITILLLFRSLLLSCYVLGVALFSNTLAFGWASYVGIQLTPPSGMASIIVLTLAVASCVHIINALPNSKDAWSLRVASAVGHVRQPVVLACLTTAIGFLSLNFNDSPPYRDLGNITAVGVMSVAFASLVLFPWFLRLRPLKLKIWDLLNWQAFTELLHRFKGLVVVSFLLFLAAGMMGLTKIEINDKFNQWFHKDTSFRQQSDFIAANLTGMYSLELELSPGTELSIENEGFLAELKLLHDIYEQNENVWAVTSILAGTAHRTPSGLDFATEESPDAAAGLRLIANNGRSTRMTIVFKQADSKYIQNVVNTLEAQTIEFKHLSLTRVVGPAVMFSNLTERNLKSQFIGLGVTVTLVMLLFVVSFRSINLGLLALVANILPLVAGFCIWSLVSPEIGLAVSIVACCALGLIIDDTIHFLYHFNHFQRRESDITRAIAACLRLSGQAIIITTSILTLGFLVLLLSDFLLNVTFAYLTILIMLCALVFDVVVLPAIILLSQSWRSNVKKYAWN